MNALLQNPKPLSFRWTLLSALLILLVSGAFAVASNRLRPQSLALFKPMPSAPQGSIDLFEGRKLWGDDKAVFLDGRSEGEYFKGRISRALHLPLERFESLHPALASRLAGKTLVVYCSSRHCSRASSLALLLKEKGHAEVLVLKPGYEPWAKDRLPTESGRY